MYVTHNNIIDMKRRKLMGFVDLICSFSPGRLEIHQSMQLFLLT